jgi:hypothetical protein
MKQFRYFTLLFSLFFFLIGCKKNTDANETAKKPNLDSSKIVINPILDTIKPDFTNKTEFGDGVLTIGSFTSFVENNCKIYSDSSLTNEINSTFSIGDTVYVLGYFGSKLETNILRHVLGIEIHKNGKIYRGFVNEQQLAIHIEKLADGNFLLLAFSPEKPVNNEQKISLKLVNELFSTIQKFDLFVPLETYQDDKSYFFRYLSFTEKTACLTQKDQNQAFYIYFGYDACGYYTSEYFVLYENGKLFKSPKFFSMGDGDVFGESYELITKCDSSKLDTKQFLVNYSKFEQKESSGNSRLVVNEITEFEQKMNFIDKKGFELSDTLNFRVYLDTTLIE